MLITLNVKNQKVTHDLKGALVAGSVGIVQVQFLFDEAWDEMRKVIVFSSSKGCKPVPVKYTDEAINIPAEVLKPGKLYISCIGFSEEGQRITTQAWDIQQAITVQKCGDLGACDLLMNLVTASDEVSEKDVATDSEVNDMLDDVFGESGESGEPGEDKEPTVDEDDIATDEEVHDMLDDVFGAEDQPPTHPEQPGPPKESEYGEDEVATDEEVSDMLDEIFGS